ncbi:MAG: ADP-ribosylation factor-like protein [Promethearchaeota archaeon]
MINNDQLPKAIKVILTGLDNAGKTSIINILLRNKEELSNPKPTRGAKVRDYPFLGMNIAEWDLGGQKVYRKAYLNKQPEIIFGNAKAIIHVVDIQDEKRIEDSMDYLVDIYEKLIELKVKPTIYIFFHKYDPVSMIGSQSDLNNHSLLIRNAVKKLLNYPKIEFYRTSIYDFQMINMAMSKILLSYIPRSDLIENTIKQFSTDLNFEGLELIDENSLILGSFYLNKFSKELMNSVTPFFLEVNEILEKVPFSQPNQDEIEDEMLIRKFGRYFLFKKFALREDGSNFYFLGCKRDSDFKKEDFLVFVNLIREMLVQIL